MDSSVDRIKAALEKKNSANNTVVNPTPQPDVVATPTPAVTVIDINSNQNTSAMAQQTVQMDSIQATAQAQASVGLAQTNLDEKVIDEQIGKEEEHWVKAYWRPAMGWLYMLICFMDFIGFPAAPPA